MKPLHVASWGMKTWRGIWSPSGNCFQETNCILVFLCKNKLYHFYQCPPSQMLSGVYQVCVQNFMSKRYSSVAPLRKNCKQSHFVRLGSLLLIRARSICRSVKLGHKSWSEEKLSRVSRTLGLEGKHSLTRGATWELLITSYLPYSKSPTPKELINSHLERQKSPQGRECAGGGTSEGKKPAAGWGLVAYMQLRWR